MAQLTKELADTMSRAGVHLAYGDPVELDGTTLMPVACVSFGFGAAEGGHADEHDGDADERQGSGGGGGGGAIPLGAYISRGGATRFEPNPIALLVVATPFVWIAGRALSRIIRALKR